MLLLPLLFPQLPQKLSNLVVIRLVFECVGEYLVLEPHQLLCLLETEVVCGLVGTDLFDILKHLGQISVFVKCYARHFASLVQVN